MKMAVTCMMVLGVLTTMGTFSSAATVAYWRFETGPANADVAHPVADGTFYVSVPDSSGNGNHLSAWSQGGWAGYQYRADVAVSAIPLTGADNLFSVKNTGNFPGMFTMSAASNPSGVDVEAITPHQFTIEAFFKPENGGHRTLVGRDAVGVSSHDSALAALYLKIAPDNSVSIQFADVSGYWHEAASAAGLIQGFSNSSDPAGATGRWYYMAGVSDGATLSLYLADTSSDMGLELVARTDLTASGSPNTALAKGTGSGSDWHAGGWSVGRGFFNGEHRDRAYGFIDEVRISDSALNPAELLFQGNVELAVFASHWLASDCHAPTWCDNSDLDRSGHVNYEDWAIFARHWKEIPFASHNWMRAINGSAFLSQLSIPGTHDSGALYEPFSGTAKCQSLTIAQQLDVGVRFLDIRCRHVDNAFAIHHGSVYQNMNFDNVLDAVIAFLNNNPSECVIMSVKEEHTASGNTRSFEATFDAYVQKNPGTWHLGDSVPRLREVRGRIVLLRRFGASGVPKGINATNWKDNTTFSIAYGSTRIRVQDYYQNTNSTAKWNAILPMLNEASAGSGGGLYLNFTSGYVSGLFGIPNITTISNAINPQLTTFFTAHTSGRFGVIIMDFVNAARSGLIIDTNFDEYATLSNGTYRLLNDHSGKALSVASNSTANGANVVQRDWSNTSDQRWILTHQGGGFYQLLAGHSVRALTLASASSANGINVEQRDWNGGAVQIWQVVGNGDGTYRLLNAHSGLALEVYNALTGNNANVDQWNWSDAAHKTWRISGL